MNLQENIRRILREDKVCDYDVLYDIAQKISNTLHCDRVGNCVHFAELFVERINQYDSDLLNCFDVVEGYVITKIGDGIPQQHTWIQLRNGEKIDPTFIQFKKWDDNSMYSKNIASKSSGEEYYEWGKEGTWFSERRKQFPNYIFKDDKNLQESIRRILVEETHVKIKSYIKEYFDEVFDKLNLIPIDDELLINWVDVDGSKMFQRNWWGVFWINNCEIYRDLKNFTLLFSMSQEEFETNLLEYLNTKYEKEFKNRPLKEIGDEYFCLEGD